MASFYSTEDEGHHHPRHPVAAAGGDKLFSLSKSTFTRSSERVSKWTAAAGSAVHHAVFSPLQHMAELRGVRGREGGREERHAKFSPMLD